MLPVEVPVWAVHREIEAVGMAEEVLEPKPIFFSFPAGHCPIINREGFIRYHLVFVNTHYLAEAFTGGAGPEGVVEIEKLGAWLGKSYPVQLKAVGKNSGLSPFHIHDTFPFAFIKGRLRRIGDAPFVVFLLMPDHKAVN